MRGLALVTFPLANESSIEIFRNYGSGMDLVFEFIVK